MVTLKPLMQEIIQITTVIETDYPELYKYLNENPLTIKYAGEGIVMLDDLKLYLETLKTQLQHHIETHKNLTL